MSALTSADIGQDRSARPGTADASEGRGRFGRVASLLLIAPLGLLLAAVFFLPIVNFLSRSFIEPQLTLSHYAELFGEPLYLRILLRTMWIALATTALTLVLGYPVALLMTRINGVAAAVVSLCVIIPLWTSVLVRSYAWIVLLQRNGLVNQSLQHLGIIDQPLTLLHTDGAVLVAMTQVLLPFMVLPVYATLRNIPPELTRAARNLGAGRLRAFLAVTLPLSLPGAAAGAVMIFVLALGFYITPALVGGPRTLMIATLISQQATELSNWPLAAALSFVLLVLSLGVTMAFKRLLGVDRMVHHG
ncbi:ABC transporter permease [Agaricicola taiwanensis]|uniref:ABC transporter permease n=1 Tax=Agaricicola taiwanensis TaxID=591372 RepID=A0A8J2VNY3_9RHOB|nr:ABC transporter permease [Agaricicola taiwanensis]GGE41040.1 ABC transporter permease [Agaricicola taiwanensis]